MIRILHIIDSFDLGGAQTALLNFLRFADRSQFHVEVANLHGQGVFQKSFEELGIPIHSLAPHRWPPIYIPRLIHVLKQGKFDIIHCHLNASNWIAKPIAAACGVRIRITHDQCNDAFRSKNPAIAFLDALTNRLSSLILAVSHSTRHFLISQEALNPSKIVLLPNAVDTEYFALSEKATQREAKQQLGFDPDCFLVAGVGRLVPQKNYPTFLSTFFLLHQKCPKSRFAIAGTGPEEARLRRVASQLGITQYGHFLGFLADPRSLYQACDVLFLPSLYEGLPLTALEAMASAVPVVASPVDGLQDLIRSGENGLLTSTTKPAEFTKLLQYLHDSPTERNRIASAARTHVKTHYNAQSLTQQLEQLYLKLFAENLSPNQSIALA